MLKQKNIIECPTLMCRDCNVYQLAQEEINIRNLSTKAEIRTHAQAIAALHCPPVSVWTDTLQHAKPNQQKERVYYPPLAGVMGENNGEPL